MHPYRALWCGEWERSRDADEAPLARALAVLAAVSAIEVATSLIHGGPLSPQTVFGFAMLVTALAALVRHAGSGAGSRSR